LDTFTYDLRTANPAWLPDSLPSDMSISRSGLNFLNDQEYSFTTPIEGEGFMIIINPAAPVTEATNTIVLEKEQVLFFDGKGNFLKGDYDGVSEIIDFSELKTLDKSQAVDVFMSMIDGAFSPYAVLYSILVNTMIQFGMNIILLLILAGIFLMIRVNYKPVTNFGENINIIVASMTIPALIGFLVGMLGIIEFNSFTVVLFQFLTPLIAMLAIYKGSGQTEVSTKNV
jgi:maltodextrin utilization protein YvdJ